MKNFKIGSFLAGILITSFLLFSSVGFNVPAKAQGSANAQYLWIHTGTTTTVKAASGFINTLTLNGGTPGVVTLYDIGGVGCTGTPGSGPFATIEAITSTNPTTLSYQLKLNNGLCIVTAAATDLTVSFN